MRDVISICNLGVSSIGICMVLIVIIVFFLLSIMNLLPYITLVNKGEYAYRIQREGSWEHMPTIKLLGGGVLNNRLIGNRIFVGIGRKRFRLTWILQLESQKLYFSTENFETSNFSAATSPPMWGIQVNMLHFLDGGGCSKNCKANQSNLGVFTASWIRYPWNKPTDWLRKESQHAMWTQSSVNECQIAVHSTNW